MEKIFLIINYNTQHVTECCVRSILKHVENSTIYIFDNSDKKPFVNVFDTNIVKVFDNTKQEIINFNKIIVDTKHKGSNNNYASFKHCISVDKCFDLIGKPFVLLDSDVLLKRDISCLFDDRQYCCGEIKLQYNQEKRLAPFLLYINVPLCLRKGIRFYDYRHMLGFNNSKCDTGRYFLLSLNNKNITPKIIKLEDFIFHYGGGSWGVKNSAHRIGSNCTHVSIEQWLLLHQSYYDDGDMMLSCSKIDKSKKNNIVNMFCSSFDL